MNTIFIGIAGGTGSGKTTLTEHLAARFGSDISAFIMSAICHTPLVDITHPQRQTHGNRTP